MRLIRPILHSLLLSLPLTTSLYAQDNLVPGTRTIIDAHNCYPYNGRWADRIDKALATGTPVGIEQDVVWFRDPKTGVFRSVLSHDRNPTGDEPTLESYFFAKVKPLIEEELAHPHPTSWPIITLNIDMKTTESEHVRSIRGILLRYKSWLTVAKKSQDIHTMQPLRIGPLLVLVGPSDAETTGFYDEVPVGGDLIAFGAARAREGGADTPPQDLMPEAADNYHRWWNNPWTVVEAGGASKAGPWSVNAEERLKSLVEQAHDRHLWVRFYTIDGESADEAKKNGWFATYNLRDPLESAKRIRSLVKVHADWIATDQVGTAKQVAKEEKSIPR